MPPLKNLRQETFCQEWIKDHNGIRSYKVAGYTGRNENVQGVGAHQLLSSTKVKARILELEGAARALVVQKAVVDRAWVVGRLVENVDRSMQAVPVLDGKGLVTGQWRYEGNVANRGLELIGKDLGMFADKNPLDGLFGGAAVQINVYLPGKRAHDHGNGHATEGNGAADR